MIINIDASTYNGRIQIGKQGENLTTSVVFDCNAWLSDLDGGTLSIVHQRNSDPDAYPCGDYELDGKVLTWHINETDVAFCGIGACELRYTIGERIAKSKTFVTQTLKGLDPNETPPEAWEPYIDRVIDAATQEMENMTVSASATSGEQTSVSVTKTRIDDHENLDFDFVVEKGDKGDPGQDGQDGKSIVNATASIDANVGTPYVTVTTSSSDAGLTVDLAFHNMKGIPGTSFDTSYLPSDTASGNPATFPDGAKAVPVDELTAEIVASQDLHGYDKPWAGGAGKNKIDDSIKYRVNATTVSIGTNHTFSIVLPAGTYTIQGWFASGSYTTYIREENDGSATNVWFGDSENYRRVTMTLTGGKYRILCIHTTYVDIDNITHFQIEAGSSSTAYEPYSNVCPIVGYSAANITHNGETDTIPFGQTVYGGSLNVTTGVLTITHANIDLGTLDWFNSPNGYFYNLTDTGVKSGTTNWVSSSLYPKPSNVAWNAMTDGMAGVGGTQIRVKDSKSANAIAFKTNISGTYFCYEMGTSQTVQLTPDEVRTVLGNNSVSSDLGGDVTVIYRADIGKYIDKRLS